MDKKTNRWLDVQVVIAAMAMVASLTLWNLFASGSRTDSSPAAAGSQISTQTSVVSAQPPVRILLGGPAPQTPAIQQSAPGPAPVTVTSSSRP